MHGFDVHESGKTWHGRTSQKYPSILKRQQSRERREVSWIWGNYILMHFEFKLQYIVGVYYMTITKLGSRPILHRYKYLR